MVSFMWCKALVVIGGSFSVNNGPSKGPMNTRRMDQSIALPIAKQTGNRQSTLHIVPKTYYEIVIYVFFAFLTFSIF